MWKQDGTVSPGLSADDPTEVPLLLTPSQAAKVLGISPGTLAVWRSTGRYALRYVKIGSRIKYQPEDLNQFIQERTRSHTGQDGV